MKIFLFLLIFYPYLIKSFEEISVEVSINEEQENGTVVVDLSSHILTLPNQSNGYIVKFVRPCLYFYFDGKNSFLIRSLTIDREVICPYEKNCSLLCNLFIQKEEILLIKLKINIDDINDHQPKFLKKFYAYEFEENLSIGFHFQLEQAEDKDLSEKNSIKNYYLNQMNSSGIFPFKLNFDKQNHLLELILINKLEKDKFLFELIVYDGGNQEDKCLIEIHILKNHNLPPEFDSKLYKFFIFNQNQIFIGQVKAKNHFNNQQIYYRLIPSIENDHLFRINQTTGEIFLKENKIFFDQVYEIFIEAFCLNYLSSLTTVQIYFNFTEKFHNDQENFIQILIPKLFQKNPNENKIFLKENLFVPLTILQLFSSSAIEMKTSAEKNYFQLKQLDQQSFDLILLKSFDYELIQNISLEFILNKQNLIKKSFEIIIENVNDCKPFFNQTTFVFQIQENNQVPFLLHTFQAFDQDYLNDTIYEIQTSDENTFSINSTSGEFRLLKSLDREKESNYSLSVCAFDQIYRTCSSVVLNVLDENDNICQFNSSSLTLSIKENLPSNTFLVQLQAFDPDYKQNGTLQYSLSPPETSYLTINSTTGIIQTTTNAFDYELIQTYSSLIIACDNIHSFPSLCCSLQLNLNILDLNDNLPYLVSPSSSDDIFIINYTNKTMPRLKAFDNDIDLNNRFISYSIIGGSLNSSITIDYLSGQLYPLHPNIKLPLFGTLLISLSSQTQIQLTILIHDNQTNPQAFIMAMEQSLFSPQLFCLIIFISIGIFIFLIAAIFLIVWFCKQKRQEKQDDDPLMNTPSTTTLSTRSISTNKKIYETYYSFGNSVPSRILHI